MNGKRIISELLLLTVLCGCAVQRAETAKSAKVAMVGMTKEQVLACAGPPAGKAAEGSTEVWSYPSGNGAVSTYSTASTTSQGTAFGTSRFATAYGTTSGWGVSHSQQRFCVVNVVMTGGTVAAVNYNGPTGGLLTQGEQCAFAVQNCVR
jgi:hypothetical protein